MKNKTINKKNKENDFKIKYINLDIKFRIKYVKSFT